jgi:sulfofructose kinase
MTTFDVVCVGSVTVDSIAVVDHVPADDERIESAPFIEAGGGPAATAAVALARLGLRVAFCGVVGSDEAGERARELLDLAGVDTRWVRAKDDAHTARSMVFVSRSTGSRSIVTVPAVSPTREEIPVGGATWLHVDQTGYHAAREALSARGNTTQLSVDAGNPIPGLDVASVDLYVPTLARLTTDFPADGARASFAAADAAGAKRVVATAGVAGSYLWNNGDVDHVRSFPIDLESTMGAGDVFHGAMLAGLIHGRSLREATMLGNAVAALSCRALDGRSAIPDLAEAERFIAERSADHLSCATAKQEGKTE